MKFGAVPALPFDETSSRMVAIVGTGTSLDGVNLSPIDGYCPIITVNSAIFQWPWAMAGFSLDWSWFRAHQNRIERIGKPFILASSQEFASGISDKKWLTVIQRREQIHLSPDRMFVYGGETSGFGALQVALLMGFRSIFLFGFDHYPKIEQGLDRWHTDNKLYDFKFSDHRDVWRKRASFYNSIVRDLDHIGARVINASPKSLIGAFPKLPPRAAIDLILKGTVG